jgi:Fe-S-cluster-containing hydrogenase component 2
VVFIIFARKDWEILVNGRTVGSFRKGAPQGRAVPKDIQSRFRSVGWKAEIASSCIDCGKCVEVCPVDAISFEEESRIGTVSSERCLGRGICASRCPESSIRLKLRDPLRDDLADYFAESGLMLDLRR